jgi:hypothetical protein
VIEILIPLSIEEVQLLAVAVLIIITWIAMGVLAWLFWIIDGGGKIATINCIALFGIALFFTLAIISSPTFGAQIIKITLMP